MYSRSTITIKKCVEIRRNIPSNLNTNYRMEMKLVPINMDYCLLHFHALKFYIGVPLHGGSLPNFNYFNVNSQI